MAGGKRGGQPVKVGFEGRREQGSEERGEGWVLTRFRREKGFRQVPAGVFRRAACVEELWDVDEEQFPLLGVADAAEQVRLTVSRRAEQDPDFCAVVRPVAGVDGVESLPHVGGDVFVDLGNVPVEAKARRTPESVGLERVVVRELIHGRVPGKRGFR